MEIQRFHEKYLCDAIRLASYLADKYGAAISEGIGDSSKFPGNFDTDDIRFLRVEKGVTLYEIAYTTNETPTHFKHRNKGIHRVMIGEEIKRVREERGLTLEELSEQTDFKPHSLMWIEQGRYDIDVTQLGIILDALGAKIRLV